VLRRYAANAAHHSPHHRQTATPISNKNAPAGRSAAPGSSCVVARYLQPATSLSAPHSYFTSWAMIRSTLWLDALKQYDQIDHQQHQRQQHQRPIKIAQQKYAITAGSLTIPCRFYPHWLALWGACQADNNQKTWRAIGAADWAPKSAILHDDCQRKFWVCPQAQKANIQRMIAQVLLGAMLVVFGPLSS
jgi:hypothetical protein